MTLSSKDKSVLWTFFFIAWTVIWIRAAIIPVFPDEVFSWFLYGESGYFFPPAAQVDANNHILNSILTWCSAKLFGVSALAIRLPNVLSFALFYVSIIGMSKFLRTAAGSLIAVLSLSGIFYILEFFSLSRGYGLSFAFLAFTVWQFMEFQRSLRAYRLMLVAAGMLLALSCNLSLIFTFIPLFLWAAALLLFREKHTRQKSLAIHWLLIFAIGAILFAAYRYLDFLHKAGMLYYGTKGKFPLATIKTLLVEIFGNDRLWLYYFLLAMLIILVLGFAVRLLKQKITDALSDQRLVLAILFFANAAGICFSVWFMHAAAPSDRTAAHLVILFVGALVFLKPAFDSRFLVSYMQPVMLVFPLLSLMQFNLKMHHFWREDQLSPRIYSRLAAESATVGQPVTLSGFRYFDRTYAFENTRRGNSLPTFDLASWPRSFSDFLLIRKRDFNAFRPSLSDYRVLVKDNVSGNMLLKRRRPTQMKFVARKFNNSKKGKKEYLNFAVIDVKKSASRNLVAAVAFRLSFKGSGEQFILTSAITDSLGKPLTITEHLHLNQLKSDWRNTKPVHFTLPFYNLPENAANIKIYLYNDKKAAHGNFNAETRIYTVTP